jgi:opacity protein-like surface antigen
MTSLRSWFVSGAVLAMAAAASPVQAQDSKFTASVNFGFQAGSGDISQTLQPVIYDEAAKIDVAQTYENGPLIDVGGTYLIFGKWGASVAYNHTSGDGNASISGAIPDPFVTDSPRAVALSANGLKHNENAVHVDVVYRFAATKKIDVTVGVGPTFFSMDQEFVTEVAVTETATVPPFTNPTATATVSKVKKSPVGFNIGADVTYMLTHNMGVGMLLRFAQANPSLDVPNTPTPIDVRAGGFQVGGGFRYRF